MTHGRAVGQFLGPCVRSAGAQGLSQMGSPLLAHTTGHDDPLEIGHLGFVWRQLSRRQPRSSRIGSALPLRQDFSGSSSTFSSQAPLPLSLPVLRSSFFFLLAVRQSGWTCLMPCGVSHIFLDVPPTSSSTSSSTRATGSGLAGLAERCDPDASAPSSRSGKASCKVRVRSRLKSSSVTHELGLHQVLDFALPRFLVQTVFAQP